MMELRKYCAVLRRMVFVCAVALLACQAAPEALAAEVAKETTVQVKSSGQPVAAASKPAAEAAKKPPAATAKPAAKKSTAKPAAKKKAAPAARKNSVAKAAPAKKSAPVKTAPPKAAAKAVTPAAGQDPAAKASEAPKNFPVSMVPKMAPAKDAKLPVPETWTPLMRRLAKDGIETAYLRGLFGRLGDSYSHVPMGTKINELFTYKYMSPPPRKTPRPPSDKPTVYKSMVKPESVEKCKTYLARHEGAFKAMEAQYGVPKEVVAGLLMVETRLGTYLGSSSSFWSLACLAAADAPERVEAVVQELPLPMTPDKEEWLKKLLKERSAWAYKELLALVRHSKENGLDPLVMPGSVYGAIGICQFMPSNLPKFAVDGNKDGKIDLFDPEDAIPSVANYLQQHGWEGGERTVHHATLKRYNKSNIYANTILALAEAIVAPPGEATADAPAKAAPAKKTAVKKAPAKTAKSAAKAPAKKAGTGKKKAHPVKEYF